MTRTTAGTEPVVVTGMGAVTPLGLGPDALYERWRRGDVAVDGGLGRCADFDPAAHLARKQLRRTDRFTQFALVAAEQALTEAGWLDGDLPYPPERVACVFACSMGGVETFLAQHERFLVQQRPMSPYTTLMFMANAAASVIAHQWGLRGESSGVMAACASGTLAFGTALRMLAGDEVDAVLVGGAEAPLAQEVVHAFTQMGALSRSGVVRPFDRRRDGFALGEGAGALVLERAAAARGRGAPALGRILGFGSTTDAYDLAAPDPAGRAAALAMTKALKDAGLRPADLSYVNSHGTGSPHNDSAETRALKTALGDDAHLIPISSTKSSIGHLMGGAGTVEAISTLLALRHGVAPPTLGLEDPDDGLDLNYVQGKAQDMPEARAGAPRTALSNSFGLGGINAVVALGA